jgi:60 kDa SS-A/Ro ribonucleoprotein
MANKNIFKSNPGNVKDTNGFLNEAGDKAYALNPKEALAQLTLTGCFNQTFYTNAEDQVKQVLELCEKCDIEYIAKLAVYARQRGLMKDAPALLAAYIATKNVQALKPIFSSVINDTKMLRNFMQIIRSGVVGRKSFGTAVKKLINNYLSNLTDEQLFKANIGNAPSLNDVIRMTHPKAANPARNALYAYIIGKDSNKEALLPLALQFEAFKKDATLAIPNVPFQMLTALDLTEEQWKTLAVRSTWNQTRMNLNTFARHNVFSSKEVEAVIAKLIQDPDAVRHSKVFPYQLFTAYSNLSEDVPQSIKIALQKAAEVAVENVPAIQGEMEICLDVSGSMQNPVTGTRTNAVTGKVESFTTKTKCIDVASLFAACFLRNNNLARVIPFDTEIKKVDINPLDTIFTNSEKLSNSGRNGATDCGCALAHLNEIGSKAKCVVFVSDNQSNVQSNATISGETSMSREWQKYSKRVPGAKLVAIDIAPYANVQASPSKDILVIGGFSDQVFDVVASFINGKENLVQTIEKCSNGGFMKTGEPTIEK